ncbi:MAG: hypothetical protein Q4G70_06620 [Pseudomonadota bacterium]|nr:hypothetical protein [Pseudomonadota bacterium]
MPSPRPRPLPPHTQRLLTVTANAWGLCMEMPPPASIAVPRPTAPRAHAAQATPAELRQWPYWPHYPGAAIGWR